MTESVTLVVKSTDTWEGLIDKVNEIANLVSNAAVTATTSVTGSTVAGNVLGTGIFSYETVAVATSMRGGNVATAAELTISSNVFVNTGQIGFGNSIVNAVTNSTSINFSGGTRYSDGSFSVGNSIVNAVTNSTSLNFDASGYFQGTTWSIGNNTINAVANSTQILFNSAQTYTGTNWYIGTATVNAIANSTAIRLANSTSSITMIKPTAAQAAGDAYFWKSDGTWSNVENLVLKVYDSANTQLFP